MNHKNGTRELPFAIEPLHLPDIEQVMAIEMASFPAPWSVSMYRHELTQNAYAHYLTVRWRGGGEAEGRVLGYGGFWLLLDQAHICTIAVAPSWRGRGLGEWMLLALLEEATAQHAAESTLEVRVGNAVAQNLYRKVGFQVVGKRPRYYTDNGEDALLMTLHRLQSDLVQANLDVQRDAALVRLRGFAVAPTKSGHANGD